MAFGNFRNNAFINTDILVDQIQPCFTRLLGCPGGNHNDSCIHDSVIIRGINLDLPHKRHAMRDIQRFSLCPVFVYIHQSNF